MTEAGLALRLGAHRRLAACLAAALLLSACGTQRPAPASSGLGLPTGDGGGAIFDAGGGVDGGGQVGGDGTASLTCPGGELCPCTSNDDCDNSLCIEGVDGDVCAKKCVADCPAGYRCSNVDIAGGDVATICTLAWGRLCDPCSLSGDCASLGIQDPACVDFGKAGHFCGAPCSTDDDCPSTHRCADVKTVEAVTRTQCLPKKATDGTDPGPCVCSKRAENLGLKTTCSVDNVGPGGSVIGTCVGERSCSKGGGGNGGGVAGLGPCEVPEATVETCDGLDNDCNGKTDDDACDDTNPCTQDVCDPKHAKGGKDGCSHTTAALPCDADGNACTENDVCKGGVCSPGAAKDCDDKNACTLDTCDPKTGCTKTDDDGKPCDDENPCTVGDGCSGGQCAGGPAKLCTSGDPCVEAKCKITIGKCDFSDKPEAASCDDGSACTTGDTCTKGGGCKAGTCIGGTPITCDDGDPCTADACNNTTNTCVYTAKAGCGGWCAQVRDCIDDGNACTTGDACAGGACKGQGKDCDDKNPCTTDTCDPVTKACKNSANTAACNDGNACTGGDVCASGICKAGAPLCKLDDACKGAGDCAQGDCVNGKCTQVASCGILGKGSSGALGDVVLSGSVVVNTSTGGITAGGKVVVAAGAVGTELVSQNGGFWPAPQVRVYHFGKLVIALNATVSVTGSHAAAFLAESTLSVAGTLDASGGNGTAGGTNTGGSGGAAGTGGAAGGKWTSGPGCIASNGKGEGAGGSPRGACGGGGSKGGDGQSGGGGGGGGAGCGGTGGPGGSYATPGEAGIGGEGGKPAVTGQGFGAMSPGSAGGSCTQGAGNTSPAAPYGDSAGKAIWAGSGGGAGGFGGFAGFGGWAKSSGGTAYGGTPGYSGGSGGGGGGGGGAGRNGGVSGGKGGDGGKGGNGGKGGDGRVRVQANKAALGTITGKLTQAAL